MAMIKCQECRSEVSSFADACPNCGAKVPHTKWWLWIPLGGVVAFLGFGAIVGSTPEAKARARERSIIETCWDMYYDDTRIFSASAKNMQSQACRKMEDDFRKKWGREP